QLFDGHRDLLAHHFEQAPLAGIQNHGLVSLKIKNEQKRTNSDKNMLLSIRNLAYLIHIAFEMHLY
ncbi:MAG: hypothetical protein RSE46_26270, partial [Janthinobacterium sp.]